MVALTPYTGRRLAVTLAITCLFNTAIAVLLWTVGFGGTFAENLVFSQSIGLSICLSLVGGLHLVRLGELVPGAFQAGEVRRFQVHYLLAGCVEERRGRYGVHPGIVVHEYPVGLVHGGTVVEIPIVQKRQAGAVQPHPVHVHIVGVFPFLPAVAAEDRHRRSSWNR